MQYRSDVAHERLVFIGEAWPRINTVPFRGQAPKDQKLVTKAA